MHDTWISVDFDGVISTYDGWKGFDVLGTPIEEVRNALILLKESGYKIVVFTTRLDTPTLRNWLKGNSVPFDSVNSNAHNPPNTSQKPIAHVIIDDRAINYHGQSCETLIAEIDKIINKEL